jgi:deoxycytidylate deaminase
VVSNFLEDDLDQWWVDKMYIHEAFVSATHSNVQRMQVGAALVIPKGGVLLKNWCEVPTRLQKSGYPKTPVSENYCVEYAENRVIYQALMNKLHTGGLTLYTTWGVCSECARTAIQFGIGRVVTLRTLVEKTPPEMEASICEGVTMLRDVGVPVVGWFGKLSAKYSIRFNGEVLSGEDMG